MSMCGCNSGVRTTVHATRTTLIRGLFWTPDACTCTVGNCCDRTASSATTHYTATALDAKHANMEELRYHIKEEHPAASPPIVVTADGKDPANKLTHYQACVPS
jgi:hypothetical protein